jgi:hypothetical protein
MGRGGARRESERKRGGSWDEGRSRLTSLPLDPSSTQDSASSGSSSISFVGVCHCPTFGAPFPPLSLALSQSHPLSLSTSPNRSALCWQMKM